jgi:hypothetical protein
MRLRFLLALSLLPLLAFAAPDRLKYLETEVTRAEAQAAGAKLALAGGAVDAYLGSAAAKQFDSAANDSASDLPAEVSAILQRAGIDPDRMGASDADEKAAYAALGFAIFKVCDGEHAALLRLRTLWSARAFDLGYLSLTTEEKTQFSPDVIRRARAELLPIAYGYVDSWLTITATAVGCAPQALRYADFALADATDELTDGILGMTRSGLLLKATDGNAARMAQALDARAKAMALFLHAARKLAAFSESNGLQSKADARAQLETFEDYDVEFKRTVSLTQTPIWRVAASANPKVSEHGLLCNLGPWMSRLVAGFLVPEWPSALAVLSAKEQHEAAAAYALAELFDAPNKLSGFNSGVSMLDQPKANTLVWRAYGATETKLELERAANSITLSAPENGVAIVKLFGHAFLLPSANRNNRMPAQGIHWYTLAEIQADFRDSYAYRELSGATLGKQQ